MDDVYSFETIWLLSLALGRGLVVTSADRQGITYTAGPLHSAVGPMTFALIRWTNGGETTIESDAFEVARAFYFAVDFNEAHFAALEALERHGRPFVILCADPGSPVELETRAKLGQRLAS